MHLPVQMAQPQAAAAAAAPARPAALGRPVILPPEFTGTSSEDWLTFMGQFNVACQANGYADEQRLDFLPCRLREGAFHVYQTFRAQHPNDAYDELCDRLTAYFNPPQHRPSFEAEFRARTMKTIESPVEFASALQKLATRAYPGQENTDLFQRLLVNQFIDGLPSPELRLHVRSASPNNLAQAVQRALEMAAIFDAEQRRSNGAAIAGASPTPAAIFAVRGSSTALPPAPSLASASTTGMTSASGGNYVHDQMFVLDKILQRLDSISLSLSSPSPGSLPPSAHASGGRGWSDSSQGAQQVRRCFNCGQTGHLVRACPNYPEGARRRNGPQRRSQGN